MTALATDHLTDLRHQLHHPHTAHDAAHPATPAELARLVHVLARYTTQIADGFGAPHPAGTGVRAAARRATALLDQAKHHLGPPAQTPTPHTALAEKLRAASIALGCGLDLLSTHFPVTTDQATSTTATVITAPDTARALLHQLSTHAATAGHLAHLTGPPADQAAALLLKAAVLARVHGENETSISAVPLHHKPDRIPPAIGETPAQARAGIDASVHRLSNPDTLTSITTWRYLARAAAIICDLNHKTLHQLIYRMQELNEPGHVTAFRDAASHMSRLRVRWRTIVQRWNQQTGHYGHPANGPATDASDLILRLGRLIHADPAWTPSPRASCRLKLPHQLAPDLPQAADVAITVLKAIEACNNIAAHHHAAINDAATLGALNHHQKHPTHKPRFPASARDLSERYKGAETKGRHTLTNLGQEVQALNPNNEEANLVIRRAATSDNRAQPKLSAAEFPTSIEDCLDSPKSTPGGHSDSHLIPTPSTGSPHHLKQ